MEVVSDLVNAAQLLAKSADGSGRKTMAYAVKSLVTATAALFGIPAGNLARDLWAILRTAATATDNIPLQYQMEKAIYSLGYSGNSGRYYDLLYKALEQGDMDSYQHIREDLMNSMGLDGVKIDRALQSRYNKAREKDPGYSLPQAARDLIGSFDAAVPESRAETERFSAASLDAPAYQAYAAQRASEYRSMTTALEGSELFREMSPEAREKVLDAAYDLAAASALADNSGGQYEMEAKWMTQAEEAEAAGIQDWAYILFRTAYSSAESTKDAEGKVVEGEAKSDHVREWLEDFSGLTEAQRAYLWSTVYKSDW